MSIEVMAKVWKHSQHSGSELLLLLALADHAHDDGTNIHPSQSAMAKKVRMSERSIRYLLDKICASGELVRDGFVDTPNGKVVKYKISLSHVVQHDSPRQSLPGYDSTNPGNGFPPTPAIAVADKPSINHQLISETIVSPAERVSVRLEEDDHVLTINPGGDKISGPESTFAKMCAAVEEQVHDDPSSSPEERAGWLLVRYTAQKGSRERLTVLGEAFQTVFGQEPAWKRLTSLRAKYGVLPVAEMIYRSGDKTIVGDPMDYISGALAKASDRGPIKKRIAWHPAGYRSEVDDADLTVSELWIKYRSANGTPHVISVRTRLVSQFSPNHQLFEHRAHLAWAALASPGWLQSDAGKELRKKYERDLRRANLANGDMESLWETYCEHFVPAEYRDAIKETQIP